MRAFSICFPSTLSFSFAALFNTFGHKTFVEYKETLQGHLDRDSRLRPTSPQTAFAATTVNMGPHTTTPPHTDPANLAHGWCTDTALGDYDPDKGGHLVLWNLGLVIRVPPGSSILFPSAIVTHSNIPIQAHETRYSLIQYSASALFRWRYNGWCSDKAFVANATPDELQAREDDRARRWRLNLNKFTLWSDLVEGDWKGKRRADAGLDELSDLSDVEEADAPQPAQKRRRHR